MIEDGHRFRCEVCNIGVERPSAKYIFNIKMVDYSGELYLSTYNEFGAQLLGNMVTQGARPTS